MELLTALFSLAYQYADAMAVLGLTAIGLIIVFGMMGVINMAHGEMMMIGAYVTSWTYYAGVPAALAIGAGGIAAGFAGVLVERLLVRRFYGQLLASLVATWGLSLVLSQGSLLLFGPQMKSVPTPFGSFAVGAQSFSYYRLTMFFAAVALLVGVWLLFTRTRFGMRARATMERPDMARAIGVDVDGIYMLTFALGTALAGIAGGLYALTATVGPTMGQDYTPQAFITVVVGGGADVFAGLVASVLTLGAAKTLMTNQFNVLLGYVGMLSVAMVIIWFMPAGISDWIERRRQRVVDR